MPLFLGSAPVDNGMLSPTFSSIGPLTGDSGGTRSADTGRRGRQRQRVSKLGVCWEK